MRSECRRRRNVLAPEGMRGAANFVLNLVWSLYWLARAARGLLRGHDDARTGRRH